MRLLVTGAAGFIGREVVFQATAAGHLVLAFDRHPPRFEGISGAITAVTGDLLSPSDLARACAGGVDAVVHLAYDLDLWGERPEQSVPVNVSGFVQVLDAARAAGARRVVWASSNMVYAPAAAYPPGPVTEDAVLNPVTPYGACKAFDEWLGRHYAQQLGMPNVALRLTTVYGPGRRRGGAAAFIIDLLQAAATGAPYIVRAPNRGTDLLHVQDAARALLLAAAVPALPPFLALNIGGSPVTAGLVADWLRRCLPEAQLETGAEYEPDLWPPVVDCRTATCVLGYRPDVSRDQGLLEYLNWWRREAGLLPVRSP